MFRHLSTITILLLLFAFFSSQGQYRRFNRSKRPTIAKKKVKQKKEQKVNWKETLTYRVNQIIKDADFYFEIDEAYDKALSLYLEAHDLDSANAKIHFKIGVCYIYTQHPDIKKSIFFLEKSLMLNSGVSPHIYYYLGLAYHNNEAWNKAIENYEKHLYLVGISITVPKNLVEKKIKECNTAIVLSKRPKKITLKSLGNINSEYSDYCPVLSHDQNTMYFTSRREDSNTGFSEFQSDHFEDIYICKKESESGWSRPELLNNKFNSLGHDATGCISPDGKRMITYRNGDLYESFLFENEWTKPKRMSSHINSFQHESSACFSIDGKTLYFISGRHEGSQGGLDIFKSKLQANGKWGKAINLGSEINTKYDEEGVFIHPNGKELIFSSEGHNTIGGFDLFKSKLKNDNSWDKPENMGFPINSAGDDVFLVIDNSGKHGYYASSRKGGLGNKDLYEVTFSDKEFNIQESVNNPMIIAGF